MTGWFVPMILGFCIGCLITYIVITECLYRNR